MSAFNMGSHLNDCEKRKLHATLLENCDIFDTGVGVLPAVTVIEAEIPLKSEHVVCYDPRVFLSPLQQDIAEPILENMCERGILEEIDHSNSLVPLLLVKKKTNGLRLPHSQSRRPVS